MPKKDTPYKIIVAGGGTGGHIFPAVAIANALRRFAPNTEILFVGAKGKMEMEKVPQAGYPIKGLDIAGFNRSSLLKNIGLPFKMVKSFVQVSNIFKEFQPDACIGVGGYSTYPVLRFAQGKGIKTFIHESNSFAGKANTMLGKKATKVFTATDGMDAFFPKEKIMVTGNPVRESIAHNTVSRQAALEFFGLSQSKKTVLSIGGSLGAQGINDAFAANIDALGQHGLQLIWQTGKPFIDEARKVVGNRPNIWVSDFITQMDHAYSAADIIVSRSGAMSIAEICIAGKPAVFVPYPHAAEDHQTANAMLLVNRGAALMVPNSEATQKLIPTVIALADNEAAQNEMKKQIAKFGIRDADEVVAKEILKSLQGE